VLGDEAQKLGLYFGSWLLVGMLLVLLEQVIEGLVLRLLLLLLWVKVSVWAIVKLKLVLLRRHVLLMVVEVGLGLLLRI
jgi:hypothetical protein